MHAKWALWLVLVAQGAHASEFSDFIAERQCTARLLATENHLQAVGDIWLTNPTSPYHVETHLRAIIADYQKFYESADTILKYQIADVKNLEEAGSVIQKLKQEYDKQSDAVRPIYNKERSLFISLESLGKATSLHLAEIEQLQQTCPGIKSELDLSFKTAQSWNEKINEIKAFVSIGQEKRSHLLRLSYEGMQRGILAKYSAQLQMELSKLESRLKTDLEIANFHHTVEQWYQSTTSRIIAKMHSYYLYADTLRDIAVEEVKGQEFSSIAENLPTLPGDLQALLRNRVAEGLKFLADSKAEIKGKTWNVFLDKQKAYAQAAKSQPTRFSSRCIQKSEFFLKQANNAVTESDAAALEEHFKGVYRACSGGTL